MLAKKLREAQQRAIESQKAARDISDRLVKLEKERVALWKEQGEALAERQRIEFELKQARTTLWNLQNPYSARNIAKWLLNHGLKIAIIVLGMVVLIWMSRLVSHNLVKRITGHTRATKSETEREERAKTLVSVFRSAFRIVILVVGILMLSSEVNVPILPLLSGAAVFGLAIAFATQNLLRDYFSGFHILVEDQYGIHDWVRIGEVNGLVESISLRMTTLRDIEGTLHFIPHGSITAVSNMTHGWARAMFEIRVAYKEDVNRVMQVLQEMMADLRRDLEFGSVVTGEPEFFGVENLADSAVIIRFAVKTKAMQQWSVKREFLRRVKVRFDELGIEIPYPHQIVYYHSVSRGEDDKKAHEGGKHVGA